MENRLTRDVILETALAMFASRGYAAVSMRDIAQAVGIQVSSIYHHFSGKQDIFDALICRADEAEQALRTVFLRAFEKVSRVEEEPFVQAGMFFLASCLEGERIGSLLRVLESERFHEETASRAWERLMFSVPLAHEAAVFRSLTERGEIVGRDEEELAEIYHGIIMTGYFTGDRARAETRLRSFYRRVFTLDIKGEDRP